MFLAVCLLITAWGVGNAAEVGTNGLRIALHAQVPPDGIKIVGSVITTDGIKAALRRRHDVDLVKIFYPFHYQGFMESSWDLVLIEGWFPLLHEFIQISRSHAPEAVVIFFCLDPAYPGLPQTLTFDVDGFLTNSKSVAATLRTVLPTEHLLLAADPEVMKPQTLSPSHNPNHTPSAGHAGSGIAQREGVVYVGAGGFMSAAKARMVASLTAALPFGLRIYGAGWGNSSAELRAAWGGVLPRNELARVYSTARVVMAFTIDAQREQGMVNNRVFEALSCGATVLSDWSEELAALGEGHIDFADSPAEVSRQLGRLLGHEGQSGNGALEVGGGARELILHKHTWAHRVVPLLGMYHQLRHNRHLRACCSRPNCPALLWVASASLDLTDPDYGSVVSGRVRAEFCQQYRIEFISHEAFSAQCRELLAADRGSARSQALLSWLLSYDVLLAVAVPLDGLDSLLAELSAALSSRSMRGRDRLQKWVGYLMHTEDALWARGAFTPRGAGGPTGIPLDPPGGWGGFLHHYDLLLFRDFFERDRLVAAARAGGNTWLCREELHGAARCDHLFGLDVRAVEGGPGSADSASSSDSAGNASTIWGKREKEVGVEGAAGSGLEGEGDGGDSGRGMASLLGEGGLRDAVLVVCFFRHAELCTLPTRLTAVREYTANPATAHAPYPAHLLVLVGGSWEAWLDLGRDPAAAVVHYPMLHLTTHIPPNHPTTWAHPLFASARLVCMMIPDTASGGLAAASGLTIWPFVLAAYYGVQIYLPYNNAHMIALSGEGCTRWDTGYVNLGVRTVVGKLHGLGSLRSSVSVAVLAVVHAPPAALNASSSSSGDSTSGGGIDGSSALCASTEVHVLLGLKLEAFVLGRDGQVCFVHAGRKLKCLIRLDGPYIVARVVQRRCCGDSGTAGDAEDAGNTCRLGLGQQADSVEVGVELRGNMFADSVAALQLPLPLAQVGVYQAPGVGEQEQRRLDARALRSDLFDFIVDYHVL